MGNNFKGLANLGHKKTAFTGGMLTAATGMDLLLPVPVYQRAVHWGIGGLVAPKLLHAQEITMPTNWDGLQQMGLGVMGGGAYYAGLYMLARVLS